MRVCLFEDKAVEWLEPLTLTRPAFDLWCGAMPLWQRQLRLAGGSHISALVRPLLAELCQLTHPEWSVNPADSLDDANTIFINARWLPAKQTLADLGSARVGLINDEVAYVVTSTPSDLSFANLEQWTETWKRTLPQVPAAGVMVDYPWDLVEHNPATLCQDVAWFSHLRACAEEGTVAVVGPKERLVIDAGAVIDPYVVADTRNGPVLIERGAVIHSFSRLEGPCYIGEKSWILGAKLRGGTIGPHCRIGGEVEASIVQGFSNKYHEGFLGHSYLGEWVNLAAGTQSSDLRNDYGPIKMFINGERIATGLTKVGSFIGDHTKTGLNAILNTGTAIGVFSSVLPSGTYLPATIPSFCMVTKGQPQERTDLRQLFNTASTVMRRRGQELTGAHIDFFFSLYEQTAPRRRKMLRDLEVRRLRQSV